MLSPIKAILHPIVTLLLLGEVIMSDKICWCISEGGTYRLFVLHKVSNVFSCLFHQLYDISHIIMLWDSSGGAHVVVFIIYCPLIVEIY